MTTDENRDRATAWAEAQFSETMSILRGERADEPEHITLTSTFDLEVDLEDPLIRNELNRVVGTDDFRSAFKRCLEIGAIAIDPEILDMADQVLVVHRIEGEPIPWTVNDGKGQPIRPLMSQEAHIDWQRSKAASLRARTFAMFLDEMLTQIGSRYQPHLDTVSAAFRAQFVSERDAGIFARALGYYWQSHYDDAARVALPSIESAVRAIVQTIYGGSYIEPKRHRDGRESTLGALISKLYQSLPESFLSDLRIVLTDPLGLNLRNIHLHGLAEAEPKHDAVIILYTAARLTLISAQ